MNSVERISDMARAHQWRAKFIIHFYGLGNAKAYFLQPTQRQLQVGYMPSFGKLGTGCSLSLIFHFWSLNAVKGEPPILSPTFFPILAVFVGGPFIRRPTTQIAHNLRRNLRNIDAALLREHSVRQYCARYNFFNFCVILLFASTHGSFMHKKTVACSKKPDHAKKSFARIQTCDVLLPWLPLQPFRHPHHFS